MTQSNCETCEHKPRAPEGGHCFVFETEPIYKCMVHSALPKPKRLSPALTAQLIIVVITNAERKL